MKVMPQLPSSQNVRRVNSPSDPGLSVPSFQTPTVLDVAGPVADQFAEIAIRQQNRRDTINSSRQIDAHSLSVDNELRRVNTETDLSDEKSLAEFGQFLANERDRIVNEFSGSEEARARLGLRLDQINARATGQAAAISADLGSKNVLKVHESRLSPLILSASSDPSRDNIDTLYLQLEESIDDLSGALSPNEIADLRATGREQIALTSINTLLSSGQIEAADNLLRNQSVSLSADSQRRVLGSIQGARQERDDLLGQVRARESVLGRSLTENEKLQLIGLAPKPTVRQQRINELVDRGLSPELASDIESGNVRVVGPDSFGDFFTVNTVTNERIKVSDSDKQRISDVTQARASQDEQPPAIEDGQPAEEPLFDEPIEESAKEATGPGAKIRQGISNLFGFLVEGELFEETSEARQRINTFNQIAKTALVNNDKFPVAETRIVAELLPKTDTFFVDPDTSAKNLRVLRKTLLSLKAAKEVELEKDLTTKRRDKLEDNISRIDEIITFMDTGREASQETVTPPEGARTATNPQTNERVFFDEESNSWIPF